MLLVAEPSLGEEEKAALAEVVDGGWITTGDRVRALEKAFPDQHGATDAVAVSCCTAGLHLVMQAVGIGPGDEVLVPAKAVVVMHYGGYRRELTLPLHQQLEAEQVEAITVSLAKALAN
jgi:dTDP-4-amino-4,6-dideoxygalactose transaminase